MIGPASFGPALTIAGITGDVVVGLDPADRRTSPSTDRRLQSADQRRLTGKIALVDRGTCGFIVKVKNAQHAGAIAVLVADNAPGAPPAGLGGNDPTITIFSARIQQIDGNALKARWSRRTST